MPTIIDTPPATAAPQLPIDPLPGHRLSLQRIAEAARSLDPVFRNTPQFDCEPLSAALGAPLRLKLETLNPIRSFKGRGADCFARQHAARLAGRTLVCASAGNWGQALAYVGRARGWPVVVFGATGANPLKVERMRALGAEVRLVGSDFGAAKAAARHWAAEAGAVFVEDGAEAAIAEGAGSIGVELVPAGTSANFDTLLLPLGDGALLGGVARWVKAAAPQVRVIGVCAAGADAMATSWRAGRVVERDAVHTIADGIAVRQPVAQSVADLQGLVDDVLLVSDVAIERAMRLLFREAGLVGEPAGVAGIAAILEHPALRDGQRLASVLCGSNLTQDQVARWLIDPPP